MKDMRSIRLRLALTVQFRFLKGELKGDVQTECFGAEGASAGQENSWSQRAARGFTSL